MEEKQLSKLIEKYLSHQCTEEEKAKVEQWYEAFEQEQPAFFNGDVPAINDSTVRSLKAIQEKLALSHAENDLPARSGRRRIAHLSRWIAAASVLLCISVAIGFYLKDPSSPKKYALLSTGTGEVKHWELPDGTTVWLNAGSNMRLSTDFNEDKREVYLEGEAFFDVTQHANKPFIIHSGKLVTRVLGTAFAISAYQHARLNTVSVLQGKVRVSDASNVLGDLVADKKMEYRNDSGERIISEVDAAKDVAWKSRQLVFTDLPMSDIAIHLQRWYGYQFYFKNQQLKDTRFTAGFRNTISLPDLLKVMQEVSHVNYEVDHKTKTVTFL